jgi:lipid II:glycine glycyltransferase (peptidoglycan interpeptide bridge formation enzyme)
MIVREVLPEEKEGFNQLAVHPVQSWEWGDFREKTGKKVFRLGVFDPLKKDKKSQLKAAYLLTAHPIPQTNYSVLYFPRGPSPDRVMLDALTKLGKEQSAILVKMDPNVSHPVSQGVDVSAHQKINQFLLKHHCRKAKPFWFGYSFKIDLKQNEEKLMAAMHSKTRYNIRLAIRHGVKVEEDNSKEAFNTYLDLMEQTTQRQKFYAHTRDYHQKMWDALHPADIAHLLLAKYQGQVLAAWILFTFNQVAYYPYGASTREHRDKMAAYALMWEAIKFGNKKDCHTLDLWGSLSPDPDPKDPWYGFHRFKAGFGGEHHQYLGTYDLILNFQLYPLYNLADKARWQFLRLKSRIL